MGTMPARPWEVCPAVSFLILMLGCEGNQKLFSEKCIEKGEMDLLKGAAAP